VLHVDCYPALIQLSGCPIILVKLYSLKGPAAIFVFLLRLLNAIGKHHRSCDMRRALVSLVLLLATLLLSVAPCLAVKLNSPAPDFVLKDLNGSKQALSAYKGRVVVLNFWSTTCPPCVQELPSLFFYSCRPVLAVAAL
jgi:hypothetical protein